ncbi:hypothetical protein CUJ83_02775 [Methanocella sp. CWC-04]|uniref:Uncharacterized protein n=1 Tax=Methanooceanicella nereidis TaxID=2052831 RepID=A0AAP2W6B8_9EURY|nr:HAD family hydrolase [Methanocella sp. CWC-04]MCD1293921.1 hypothetical protein [Methanocella sp. CWC-04]
MTVSNKPEAVILDIDNTVLSCDLRRALFCSEILGRHVSEEEVRHDLYCSRLLSGKMQERYFNAFLSTRLMSVDVPYPLAVDTIEVIRDRGVKIVYLSGRFKSPADKEKITIEHMKRHDLYKDGDVAIFKPSSSVHDRDFKKDAISSLKRKYDILWAMEDTPRNLRVFKDFGIFSVGITTSYPPIRFDFADLVVDGWSELKKLIEEKNDCAFHDKNDQSNVQ